MMKHHPIIFFDEINYIYNKINIEKYGMDI